MRARDGRVCAALLLALTLTGCGTPTDPHQDRVHVTPESDPEAIEIAQSVVETMGGWESWDRARYVSWKFFGRRAHHWDRESGDIRIEARAQGDDYLWLMNVDTQQGRVWKNGVEMDESELGDWLERGHKAWVNDSYWMFMPYKLLDPGVTLKYQGEGKLEDGRPADVLRLTFDDGAGYTPQNGYNVFVARDTGLVEQWAFFEDASDPDPRFTGPWSGWEQFGPILLATDHGQNKDWEIKVHDDLPAALFQSPEPPPGF